MKVFRYFLLGLALFVSTKTIQAQTEYPGYNIPENSGVATKKTVSEKNSDGTYTITLETFATGEQTLVYKNNPIDAVLVLDVSGSMCWPKGTYSQTSKTTFTYNDIVNGNVDYFRTYGNYTEQIYGEEYNGRYYLYVSPDVTHSNSSGGYLTSQGNTTDGRNNAAYSTDPDGVIVTTYQASGWSGWSYQQGWDYRSSFFEGTSRIHALKDAVNAFIETIDEKDVNEDGTRAGHRISIIKFASDKSNTVGNTVYTTGQGGNRTYNNTQIVNNFMAVENNVGTLQSNVNSLVARGGTQAGYGFDFANSVLANAASGHSKVVVFFTDGEPDDNYAAIGSTDSGAYYSKNTREAAVYSVGVYTSSPSPSSDTYKYMNYVSSNCPKATVSNGTMSAGEGASDPGPTDPSSYYKDASGNVDLTDIFVSIANGIGTADATVGSSTQIKDVVTSSFTIPSGNASEATFYTMDIKSDASGWENRQTPTGVILNIGKKTYPDELDADGQPVQRDTVGVTGFDFSAEDNWVGKRFDATHPSGYYKGKKLVIEFKVRADPNATGGDGSATNTSESGVYILKSDGTYENVNSYEVPHANLPLKLVIKKSGLRGGESATFEIERCLPLKVMPEGGTSPTDSVIVYNALGKPEPNGKWEDWSKVVLTNKTTNDGATVVKTLSNLDAGYVYKITEDSWGWSYTMTGSGGTLTTSQVEVNPFNFTNKEKSDAVKHAEAVMINHFANKEGETSRTEHAKSTKVESF